MSDVAHTIESAIVRPASGGFGMWQAGEWQPANWEFSRCDGGPFDTAEEAACDYCDAVTAAGGQAVLYSDFAENLSEYTDSDDPRDLEHWRGVDECIYNFEGELVLERMDEMDPWSLVLVRVR